MSKQTRTQIVGIYVDAWRDGHDGSSIFGKWMRYVKFRARLRDSEYMQALFERNFPDQDFVFVSDHPKDMDDIIRDRHSVIVVFPDAIGQGAAKIENYLLQHKTEHQLLRILNGRGRVFTFNRQVLRQLRFRRLLEIVPIMDCLLFAGLLVISPILLLVDTLRANKDVFK